MITVGATTRKAVRDLRRQTTQAVAVALTIALGVTLYIASAGAFRNLSGSYAHTYDRLHFADLTAAGGDPQAVSAAARAAGADRVATRTVLDPPLLVRDTKLIGRVIGLPADSRAAVNDVEVYAGRYLDQSAPEGVLVERHAADTFDLQLGEQIQVYAGGGWHPVTVRGFAVSAEYLWPGRSRQEVISDPHAFAVLFAPQPTVAAWSGAGTNQSLATLPDHASESAAHAVETAMREAGAADVTTRAEQASNAALNEDLSAFDQMSVTFPLLFLTAAAMAAYVLLARRVLAERPIIGTLLACGARRSRLLRHYLLHGVLIGLVGAAAGVVLGVLATGPITSGYTHSLGIPDTVVSHHLDLAAIGLGFGPVVGLIGAIAPTLSAARTMPAEAMRSAVAARSPGTWSRLVARLVHLPVTVRMALRDVGRSRRRTAATMLGTVLSLILVLASIGMLTSMSDAVDRYTRIQRQDATVTTAATSTSAATTARTLQSVDEVVAVEPANTGEVTAVAGAHRYTTVLTGLPADTTMHRFESIQNGPTVLPSDGALAGSSLADALHVQVGDTITLTTPHATLPVRLAGLLNEPMGTTIYTTTDLAGRVLPDTGTTTYLVRFTADADRDTMRQQITRLPGVLAYADTRALVQSVDRYLGLMWAFITVMIILGAVLAFAIIYVTMAVSVVERTHELATLRTAGVPLSRVAATVATENLLAAALGVPFGLILGVLANRAVLSSFSSDLLHFEPVLGWWPLPAATVGVLAAAAASQWPATRAIRRMDIARTVRERAL